MVELDINITCESELFTFLKEFNAYTAQRDNLEETQNEKIIRESFDRSKPFAAVAADLLLPYLECQLGIKAWITRRKETTIEGDDEIVRLLTLFGLEVDVQLAYLLYKKIDESITTISHSTIQKNMFKINGSHNKIRSIIEKNIALRIKEQYKDSPYPKRYKIVETAFAKLHLNIVKLPLAFPQNESARCNTIAH